MGVPDRLWPVGYREDHIHRDDAQAIVGARHQRPRHHLDQGAAGHLRYGGDVMGRG